MRLSDWKKTPVWDPTTEMAAVLRSNIEKMKAALLAGMAPPINDVLEVLNGLQFQHCLLCLCHPRLYPLVRRAPLPVIRWLNTHLSSGVREEAEKPPDEAVAAWKSWLR